MKNKFIVPLILILLYFIFSGTLFFINQTRFPIGTRINNKNVSFKTVDNAYEILNENLILQIKEQDEKYEIDLNKISKIEFSKKDIENILKTKTNISFFKFSDNKNHIINPNIEFDNKKTKDFFDNAIVRQPSINSEYFFENDKFVLIETKVGNELNYEQLLPSLKESIVNNKFKIEITDDFYIKPIENNCANIVNSLNKYLDAKITITLYNNIEEIIDINTIKNFIEKDSNGQYIISENYTLTLNEEKIIEYCEQLKEKYNTCGQDILFTTTNNEEIILNSDSYGWSISVSGTANKIIECLNNGGNSKIDPEYLTKANDKDYNKIENTYLEISIENQHIWFYKDSQLLWDSACVTGNVSKQQDTPTGIFQVKNKEEGFYLKETNYSTPLWVNKAIYFHWNDIKIRDDNRFDNFGGTIYKKDGAKHDIIIPKEKINELYDLLELNDIIIIY